MNNYTRFQLSLMMFMNFFIWGIWFVTMGTYLGTVLKAGGVQIGAAYGTQSLGAIIAPFIIGLDVLSLHPGRFYFILSCTSYLYDRLYAYTGIGQCHFL